MEQIDVHATAVVGSRQLQDAVPAWVRVVRLDATTYGVRDGAENRWHWVHWTSSRQRWTCGCAATGLCRHIEEVHQKVRYRELLEESKKLCSKSHRPHKSV